MQLELRAATITPEASSSLNSLTKIIGLREQAKA